MSISKEANDCSQAFLDLKASLKDAASESRLKFSVGLDDESERFDIWSNNLGAHRSDRNSLDHKLRDASHLQIRVVGFLQNIKRALREGELRSSDSILSLHKLLMSQVLQDGLCQPRI